MRCRLSIALLVCGDPDGAEPGCAGPDCADPDRGCPAPACDGRAGAGMDVEELVRTITDQVMAALSCAGV